MRSASHYSTSDAPPARPLKRFLQRELETRIGRALIAGEIPDGSKIIVDLEDGALMVRHENAREKAVS